MARGVQDLKLADAVLVFDRSQPESGQRRNVRQVCAADPDCCARGESSDLRQASYVVVVGVGQDHVADVLPGGADRGQCGADRRRTARKRTSKLSAFGPAVPAGRCISITTGSTVPTARVPFMATPGA